METYWFCAYHVTMCTHLYSTHGQRHQKTKVTQNVTKHISAESRPIKELQIYYNNIKINTLQATKLYYYNKNKHCYSDKKNIYYKQ